MPISTCSYPAAALQDSHEAYTGPFEDEQTRVFYETLPDLQATIPSALLGDTAQGPQPSRSQGHTSDQPDAGDGADIPGELTAQSCWEPASQPLLQLSSMLVFRILPACQPGPDAHLCTIAQSQQHNECYFRLQAA